MQNNCLIFLIHGKNLRDLFENCLISLQNTNTKIDKIAYCSNQSADSYKDICAKYSVKQLTIDIELGAENYSPFETTAFNIVTSYKWQIILDTIAQGYENVIYADTDIVFLKDFDSYVSSVAEIYDFGVQSESQPTFPVTACTGFMFFNKKAKGFVERVLRENANDRISNNDQGAFNSFIRNSPALSKDMYFFPEALFQNGLHYKNYLKGRKLWFMDTDLKPFLFHANYVRGLKFKIKLLRGIGLWYVSKQRRAQGMRRYMPPFILSLVSGRMQR